MNYYNVKERLPVMGQTVKIFWEVSAYGGHGIWWQGKRISDTHFQVGSDSGFHVVIDISQKTLGIGITHWADINESSLPNLCRRTQSHCK